MPDIVLRSSHDHDPQLRKQQSIHTVHFRQSVCSQHDKPVELQLLNQNFICIQNHSPNSYGILPPKGCPSDTLPPHKFNFSIGTVPTLKF